MLKDFERDLLRDIARQLMRLANTVILGVQFDSTTDTFDSTTWKFDGN